MFLQSKYRTRGWCKAVAYIQPLAFSLTASAPVNSKRDRIHDTHQRNMNERVPVAVRAVNTAAVHAAHLSATETAGVIPAPLHTRTTVVVLRRPGHGRRRQEYQNKNKHALAKNEKLNQRKRETNDARAATKAKEATKVYLVRRKGIMCIFHSVEIEERRLWFCTSKCVLCCTAVSTVPRG